MTVFANVSGVIYLSGADGSAVKKNVYASKEDVYLSGSLEAVDKRLPDGRYYLQMPREMFQPAESRRRSPLAAVVSLLVHAVVGAAITGLAYMQISRPAIKPDQTLTFLRVSIPEAPPIDIEPLREIEPLTAPEPEPEPLREPELIAELPEPPKPEPPPPPRPVEPPAPKKPEVRVGDFAAAVTPTRRADPREVQTSNFDMQQAAAPDIKQKLMEVGAFEQRDTNRAQPGADRAASVVRSGFESDQVTTSNSRPTRAVTSTGFGASAGAQQAAPRAAVKPVGFADEQPAPAAAATRQRADQAVTPVEVIAKPTPDYSAEARALKIQGEVTLEVEFTASGRVRVRRIVRGLGHGLDEMAIRAAEQIRFKPAQSGGQPIDFTANVQIVFRLT